uniref:Uncharacterized protein n=1 Tax=Arundo donax TaxID=35708 RepID=A0A0A8XNX4_ARUDO
MSENIIQLTNQSLENGQSEYRLKKKLMLLNLILIVIFHLLSQYSINYLVHA